MPSSAVSETPIAASMDVVEMDDYLLSLLMPRIRTIIRTSKAMLFRNTTSGDDSAAWDLVLMAILRAATLYISRGQTPATQALGVKASEDSTKESIGTVSPTSRLSSLFLAKWILFSVTIPTIYRLLQLWKDRLDDEERHVHGGESSGTATDDSADEDRRSLNRIARQRKRQVLEYVLDLARQTVPIVRFGTLLGYWIRASTFLPTASAPGLAMVLAGVTYTTHQSTLQHQRPIMNVRYAHRRWLLDEVFRTGRMLSFAEAVSGLRSLYDGLLLPLREKLASFRALELNDGTTLATNRSCPLCGTDAITIPYQTNCGHIHCYSCLWTSQQNPRDASGSLSCRLCRQVIVSATRYDDDDS